MMQQLSIEHWTQFAMLTLRTIKDMVMRIKRPMDWVMSEVVIS